MGLEYTDGVQQYQMPVFLSMQPFPAAPRQFVICRQMGRKLAVLRNLAYIRGSPAANDEAAGNGRSLILQATTHQKTIHWNHQILRSSSYMRTTMKTFGALVIGGMTALYVSSAAAWWQGSSNGPARGYGPGYAGPPPWAAQPPQRPGMRGQGPRAPQPGNRGSRSGNGTGGGMGGGPRRGSAPHMNGPRPPRGATRGNGPQGRGAPPGYYRGPARPGGARGNAPRRGPAPMNRPGGPRSGAPAPRGRGPGSMPYGRGGPGGMMGTAPGRGPMPMNRSNGPNGPRAGGPAPRGRGPVNMPRGRGGPGGAMGSAPRPPKKKY